MDGALASLRHHATMAALVAAYFDEDDDDWLDVLCERPSGRVLNYAIIEAAAYWRRLQELLGDQR